MIVYIVTGGISGKYGPIYSVHATLDEAKQAVKDMLNIGFIVDVGYPGHRLKPCINQSFYIRKAKITFFPETDE